MKRLFITVASLVLAAAALTAGATATATTVRSANACSGHGIIAGPFALGKKYCGTGSNILPAPVDLAKAATISWTNTAGKYMTVTFWHTATSYAEVLKGTKKASGTASVPAGDYTDATVTVTPGDQWSVIVKYK